MVSLSKADIIKQKRLHKLAQTLQLKKPWEFFESIGVFAVSLVGRNTPFYCIFLHDTIIVCPNNSALAGLMYLSEQESMPEIQRFRYQQHLALYFERLEDISEAGYRLLLDFDVEPVDHKYPVFESVMPAIMPDQLVQREIQIMLDVLKQVSDSMDEIEAIIALNHDVNTQIVHRYFDFDAKQWTFGLLDMIALDVSVPPFKLSESQIEALQAQPKHEQALEIDIAYTPIMMEQKVGHRQGVIRVLVLANHHQKEVYYQKLVTLSDDGFVMLIDQLVEYIKTHGIPKQLIVRDDITYSLLQAFNQHFDIEIIKKAQMPTIDHFVSEFILQSFH